MTCAGEFVQSLSPHSQATVVALSGELGAGKTTFVKAAAKALGVSELVVSPTFVLMKRYDLTNQKFAHLIHIDAYRMKGVAELSGLNWNALIKDPENLILIEWPERVVGAIPSDAHQISLKTKDQNTRVVSLPTP